MANVGAPRPPLMVATIEYVIEGALASQVAYHQALWDTHSCFILATSALRSDRPAGPEVLKGYKGQSRPERGFRFLKDPRFLASSLYLKKPERIMAFLMVMTVCLLVYAALEYRIRQALQSQHETFPDQKGRPIQQPTARWVFHVFVGIHVLLGVGEHPVVLNLNDQHQLCAQTAGGCLRKAICMKSPQAMRNVGSKPSRYFQSMRVRTASAAWRSARFSRNCMIVTRPRAATVGGSAGRKPERGAQNPRR